MTLNEVLLGKCSVLVPKPLHLVVVITNCCNMSKITQEGLSYGHHMRLGGQMWDKGLLYVCLECPMTFFSENLQSVISNSDVSRPLLHPIINLDVHIGSQSIGNHVLFPMSLLAKRSTEGK